MRKQRQTLSPTKIASVLIMIVALLWLTVSLPFVYNAQQQYISWAEQQDQSDDPFGSTTEEKASSSVSVSEEYMHDHHQFPAFISAKLSHAHCHNYDVYIAFHGELISPPPDHFLS